jgi:hypothetical protein
LDGLLDAVLENLKRALGKVRDEAPAFIRNGDIQRNQPRVCGKNCTARFRLFARLWLLTRNKEWGEDAYSPGQ